MPHATADDGTTIAFDVKGNGEPLVLIAGRACSHRWWDQVRGDFAAGYRTIALDAAGTGDSGERAEDEYGTRRFAADVVAVLDAADVARAHVYGTSMGGKVAQRLAIDHPGRVAALVLGCTSPGGAGAVAPGPEVLRVLAGPRDPARDEALLDLMFTPDYVRRHPGPHHVVPDDSMSPAARSGHRHADDEHDAWDELARITAPTLVVHGSDDLLCPTDNGSRIADRVPGAELAVIDGARHAYFEEFRDEAGAVVLTFLSRHALPAR
ncbi:MAG: alpha/beta fold hydrolase [Saccharothrix sp.]|nr:alpha/beta fold hydrolase [Saccharothrix sp.]